jgi:ribosomal protein S12 methylthiotransferase accessory factor
MSVGIIGSGPAIGAVKAALADVDVDANRIDTAALEEVNVAVVAGQAGDAVFERVNERALEAGVRWLAIELGGVGGIPIVDAAVAGFGPETGCYECLTGRVNANLDPDTEPTAAAPPAHTGRFAGAVAGRELARHLQDGADVFGRVVVMPHTEREFLPLPNCACDPGHERALSREHVDRTLEESLGRAERALDELLGVVQEVGEAESFPVPYYLAHGCDTAGFSDASAARNAAGVAAGWDAAFMKALGEALERYCAGVYRTGEMETGPPATTEDVVKPSAFVCETDPDPETEIHWIEGENLATTGRVKLPAEFVHYPPPTKRYRSPITTGLGLGNSSVEALLAGLYEVIERDALMLSWFSTFEPLGLAIDEEAFQTLAARAESKELDVTPLLVTQDVDVPVVAVAVHGDEWPQFALGSDADLDVTSAATSALAEALQNWMELRGMGQEGATEAMGAIGRYASFPDSVRAFVETETVIPSDSAGPQKVGDGTAELQTVLDRVDDAGLDAYAARTTTRDVASLGFEAVRVLVPEAQPLCFGSMYFGERAREVPADLGFTPDFDRDHHPFP